jgi:SAM-dependent methyltransferase
LFLLLRDRPDLLGDSVPVLHFAPEACLRARIEPVLGDRYVSTDLRRTDVTTRQDITKMTFSDGEFRTVICSHVLEHIPEDRKALSELARIVRPGGHLLVQVPLDLESRTDEDSSVIDPAERKRRWGETDHLRLYGLDLADRIREAGFAVDVLRCGALFDSAQRERYGLDENQVVFAARRI